MGKLSENQVVLIDKLIQLRIRQMAGEHDLMEGYELEDRVAQTLAELKKEE